MKGNEVIAHAAIRYGLRRLLRLPYHPAVGGYGSIMEGETPGETTGMVVLQAESGVSHTPYGLRCCFDR